MKTVIFPDHVACHPISDEAAESKYSVPDNLGFTVHQSPIVKKAHLIVEAELENAGKEFALIVNPYGGEYPYGGTNPFRVSFSQSNQDVIEYVGPQSPPEPPLPMEIVVPADSRMSFVSEISLKLFRWHGTPEVLLDWAFYYYGEPYPKGTLGIVLPLK
jgi:hypothetical protein